MSSLLSPKDLALAIGVSESSLKRWVDEGRLSAARTSGGHRRISATEAIRFIRHSGSPVVRPDVLGLADVCPWCVEQVANGTGEASLHEALIAGRAEQARGLVMAQYLASRSVCSVLDGPITHALNRIREASRRGNQSMAIEQRATGICVEAVRQIRGAMPAPSDAAPMVVGGAIEDDPNELSTLMFATTLRELGLQDLDLGARVRADAIVDAAARAEARLVWLTASVPVASDRQSSIIGGIAAGLARHSRPTLLVVGGRGADCSSMADIGGVHLVQSTSELAALARESTGPVRSTIAGSSRWPGPGVVLRRA